jgi:hypothetical protein
MACECEQQNQTSEETHDLLDKSIESKLGKTYTPTDLETARNSIKGWGLFVVPDPEKGILEYKTVYVENITYEECCKRGQNCYVYKWVHPDQPTIDEVKKQLLKQPCYRKCVASRECYVGCHCSHYRCYL